MSNGSDSGRSYVVFGSNTVFTDDLEVNQLARRHLACIDASTSRMSP